LLFSLKQVHDEQQKIFNRAFPSFSVPTALCAYFVNNQFGKIISQNP